MSERNLTQGSLALEKDKPRVITIEAAQNPKNRKLRMAAYVRVSSASEEQENSFAAQMRHYTDRIAANKDWELADIYADEAVTGTSVEKRDGFKRLLADCRRGLVDKVLTKSISRFARNTKECLVAIRELKVLGIGVVFEENGIDTIHMSGEMMISILAAKAQDESKTISRNLRGAYQQRMKRGTAAPTAAPYGYSIVDKRLVIAEEEAQVVKRIFNDYLSGCSTASIAATLSSENVLNKRGNAVWRATSIVAIISNEKYTGDTLYQKHYTTDTLPYKCHHNKGERAQYYVAETHEAIISRETFQAAQRRREERAGKIKTELSAADSPYWRKLYCGQCGAIFRRTMTNQEAKWSCRTHFADAASCPVVQIPETELNAAFLRLYYKLKHKGRPILEDVLSQLKAAWDKKMLWSNEVVALNQRINAITNQNHMLTLMKQQGGIDSDFFISNSNKLAGELRAAKLEKERIFTAEADDTIPKTTVLLEILNYAPEMLDEFDSNWFDELIEKVVVESRTRIRFCLKNGLELWEFME